MMMMVMMITMMIMTMMTMMMLTMTMTMTTMTLIMTPQCNVPECYNDRGDCDTGATGCKPDCHPDWIGDGYCDEARKHA